jgi:hypothetical protein
MLSAGGAIPPVHRLLWSQIHGLGANVIVPIAALHRRRRTLLSEMTSLLC